jgi:diguanylate cyclase (GGDEF)-like protein/PAS domain S-box-containing protein
MSKSTDFSQIERETVSRNSALLSAVDTDYSYVYVNEAYAETSNRSTQDFIGQKVAEMLGEELFKKQFKPKVDLCLAGEIVTYEIPLETPAGRIIYQATYTPMHDEDGNINGIYVNARKINNLKNVEQRLHRALHELNLAIDTAQLGLWRFDLATEKLHWNEQLLKIHGLSVDEFDGEVETWKACLHPEDRTFFDEKFEEIASPEGVGGIEFRIIRPSGEIRYLHASGRAIYDDKGNMQELVGINYDVTPYYESEHKYGTLVESAPICIHQINRDGEYISVNRAGLEMMGLTEEEAILGKPYLEAISSDDRGRIERLMQAALEGVPSEFEFKGSNGIEFSSSFVPIRGAAGHVERLLGLTQDVTERNRAQRELQFRASHDNLTGLINRDEFEQRLDNLLARTSEQSEEVHALCFMDLDQFKVVNDTCGRAAGDALLRQLGHVLQKVVRQSDSLARLGGDEFGVLMEHCTLQQANRTVEGLRRSVDEFRFSWDQQEFRIGVSIGLVAIDDQSLDGVELLKRADTACYVAKDQGGSQARVYHGKDDEMEKRLGEREWISIINSALNQDRFELYAQLIESTGNPGNKHYELLLRMKSVEGEIIGPGSFLPSAQRYSLMRKIDQWVVLHAFEILASHIDFTRSLELISINLSGQSLSSPELLHQIVNWLDEFDIDAGKICFEVTETAAIENLQSAMKYFSTLKGLGCRFALDDFGTGLSSFSYLKNLPVDFLKIDGQFVKNLVNDDIDKAMVKSINDIGHLMGLQTIAEYVETDEIEKALKEMKIDHLQGYAIGKPEPLKNLLAWQG